MQNPRNHRPRSIKGAHKKSYIVVGSVSKARRILVFSDLVVDESAQLRFVQFRFLLEVECDPFGCRGLLGGVPDFCEHRVRQRLVHSDPLGGTETQHATEDISHLRFCLRKPLGNALAFAFLEELDILLGVLSCQSVNLSVRGRAQEIEDHVELFLLAARVELVVRGVPAIRGEWETGGSREKRASVAHIGSEHAKQLCVDTSNGPDVDGRCVVLL
mmetsp:Transcript_29694/g.78789  ORF Transcript_29694/g.78789 Transcript_29694/m.78789 type:complete len:216 (-) Transcript_29694:763-1410(-)